MTGNRRPLKTRDRRWPHLLAAALVKTGLTPNGASVVGIAFAAAAGWLLAFHAHSPLGLFLATVGIQLRLLCNLLDGLMAVECGAGSRTGPLFNEAPDRIEDAFILIGAGCGAGKPWLGLLAALLAANTAYIRVLGGSLGLPQDFSGWGAKPRRMFWISLASLAAAALQLFRQPQPVLLWGLWMVTALTALTLLGRTARLHRQLKASPPPDGAEPPASR